MSDKNKKREKNTKDDLKKEKVDNKEQESEVVEIDPIVALTEENEALKNEILRKIAEFDNFKKRTAKEKDDVFIFAKANFALPIITVMDNFERALETDCSDEGFKKGVQMLFNQLSDELKKLGVEEIVSLNEVFNPEYHNAVNQIEDENFGENTVCQVFQKGYKIGEKVIRHAMVVVANP